MLVFIALRISQSGVSLFQQQSDSWGGYAQEADHM
jgi:hypothetical protein